MCSYKQLTRDDRNRIATMKTDGKTIVQIAKRLSVHRTTIDRELRRVPEDLLYDADNAHADAISKKSTCGAKSKWTPALAYQIECDLEDTWSPEQIAASRGVIAFKTIYHWLYAGLIKKSLQYLRHKGRRRQRQDDTRGKIRVGHTIDQRSDAANQRVEFGHWELDTVVSGQGKSKACVATFVERKTRFYWTMPMVDRTAASMVKAIKAFITRIGNAKAFLSFTVDRGKEFACWSTIEQKMNIPMYFCDPHSPWQRGTSENGNGLYREFFPKGTDLSKVSESERINALTKINNRPKKTLGWENCLEVFCNEKLHLI